MSEQMTLGELQELAGELINVCCDEEVLFPEAIEKQIDVLQRDRANGGFNVVVIGSFSRGKSTFINALIGKKLLYSADKESTGSISIISKAPEIRIYAETPQGHKDIPYGADCFSIIKELVYRGNISAKDTRLFVECPLEGFDSEICFVDTPGLSGLGQDQKEVTRQALAEADAVIMLLSPSGLHMDEIDLLCGNFQDLGNLRVDTLILVINRISEMQDFKKKTYDEQEKAIEASKTEIISTIKRYGLDRQYQDIQLYAIDSLDYLRSVDANVNSEFFDENDTQSIEDLRNRSRFLKFRENLTIFLEEGNRTVQKKQRLLSDLDKLCGLLDEYYGSILSEQQQTETKKREDLAQRISESEEALRKRVQKTKGDIRSYINERGEEIRDDCKDKKRDIINKTSYYIDRCFNSKEDFSPRQYRALSRFVEDLIRKTEKDFESMINEFYDEFAKEKLPALFDGNFRDFSISTIANQSAIEFSVEDFKMDMAKIKEIEAQSKEAEVADKISRKKREVDQLNKDLDGKKKSLDEAERVYRQQISEQTRANLQKLHKLGPEPPIEYRIVPGSVHKETVFLFIKKTTRDPDRKIPDDSRRTAYRNSRRRIEAENEAALERIRNFANADQARIRKEIQERKFKLECLLNEIAQCEKDLERKREYARRRNTQLVVDSQKSNLTDRCEVEINNAFAKMEMQFLLRNDKNREELSRQVEEAGREMMRTYNETLQARLDQMELISFEEIEGKLEKIADIHNAVAG